MTEPAWDPGAHYCQNARLCRGGGSPLLRSLSVFLCVLRALLWPCSMPGRSLEAVLVRTGGLRQKLIPHILELNSYGIFEGSHAQLRTLYQSSGLS